MRKVPNARTYRKVGKSFRGYAEVWFTGDGSGEEICICASTRQKLQRAWQKVTGLELIVGAAQRVRISKWKRL